MITLCHALRPTIVAGALLAAVAVAPAVVAQSDAAVRASVTTFDRAAVREAKHVHRHAMPTHLKSSTEHKEVLFASQHPKAQASSSDYPGLRYPGDLQYLGGPVVESAESHAIYLLPNGKCPVAQCWGNPEGFLRDLGRSDLIHVVDQYVGQFGGQRYGVGSHASLSFKPPSQPFTDDDMLAVVHAVASKTGQTGYGHIYHVFLPPGTDECFDSSFSVCYSPGNYNSWYFCAYHSSVDFQDIGHVLYSVEPYQNVPGCEVRPGTPNGALIDSTNNVLSHELIETITDPDGTGWWNVFDNGLFQQEIADECSFLIIVDNSLIFDPGIFRVGKKLYAAQYEYDNAAHACSLGPED